MFDIIFLTKCPFIVLHQILCKVRRLNLRLSPIGAISAKWKRAGVMVRNSSQTSTADSFLRQQIGDYNIFYTLYDHHHTEVPQE